MGYIYEDELKEILPEIMSDWIDKDDESWEWIFQEIEQKCHIGKRLKGKKWEKKLKSMVDTHSTVLSAHRNDIDELTKKVDELNKKVGCLNGSNAAIITRINCIERDITAAKQRTEVDYTKCSKEKSDADVIQEIYNRMVGRGATKEELDGFIDLINKYDALEKKEIPVVAKACETCKYNNLVFYNKQPCDSCNHYSAWEAKDNG